MHLTTTIRHITLKTGDEQTTPQGQMTDATIRFLTPCWNVPWQIWAWKKFTPFAKP